MMIAVRRAGLPDAAELAKVAAITFPLACPPSTTEAAKAAFIANSLSESSFESYAARPDHILLLAEADGVAVGYTMLVAAQPHDPDVAAALRARPTVELSKFYLMAEHHGSGASAALMDASVTAARETGAAGVWLGVNNENSRANRFYEKNGFAIVGTKKFRLGDVDEDDYVRELVF